MTDSRRDRVASRESVRTLLASVATGVSGGMVIVFLPRLVVAVADQPQFRGATGLVSLFSSADTGGMFVGGMVVLAAMRHISWRVMAVVFGVILVAGNLLSPRLATAPETLIGVRFLTGIAGGVLLAMGMAGLGMAQSKERWVAVFAITQVAVGTSALWLSEQVVAKYGPAWNHYALAALAGLALCMAALVPTGSHAAQQEGPAVAIGPGSWLALSALFIMHVAFGAVWAALGELSGAAGLSSDVITRLASLALASGLIASLACAYLGSRAKVQWMVLGAGIALLVSVAALAIAIPWLLFAATCLFVFAVNLSMPFWVGIAAATRRHADMMVLCVLSYKAGLAVGPAGGLAVLLGMGRIWFSSVLTVILSAAILIMVALHRNQRQLP